MEMRSVTYRGLASSVGRISNSDMYKNEPVANETRIPVMAANFVSSFKIIPKVIPLSTSPLEEEQYQVSLFLEEKVIPRGVAREYNISRTAVCSMWNSAR